MNKLSLFYILLTIPNLIFSQNKMTVFEISWKDSISLNMPRIVINRDSSNCTFYYDTTSAIIRLDTIFIKNNTNHNIHFFYDRYSANNISVGVNSKFVNCDLEQGDIIFFKFDLSHWRKGIQTGIGPMFEIIINEKLYHYYIGFQIDWEYLNELYNLYDD